MQLMLWQRQYFLLRRFLHQSVMQLVLQVEVLAQ